MIDALVDARFDESVAFLRELVRMPSDTPPGDNAAHAEGTAKLLEALGFTVERHPVPAELVAKRGLRSVTNLVVRHRFGPGPVIALNAHGDVVPPGDGWTKEPYGGVIDKGRMYGRGVAVSKSDFATYTFALDALKRAGHETGTVELHFTYDEEMGGELGPGWLLAHGITKPDLAIGAGFSYAVITAHNGALHLEIIVRGEAAHAAMPETGVDALEAAVDIIQSLYVLREGFSVVHSKVDGIGSPTINVGKIEGGINTNVVPDKVRFSLDRRMIPEEDPEAVEKALRETIFRAQAGHPKVRVDIRRMMLARALTPKPGHERIVKALQREGARVFGAEPPAVGVPLYTDARLYGEAGIPIVLYGAGPRTILEANAKRADENLVLEDLRKATKVVAGALAVLLAG
ncbi:peptidase M20 [Betaproteobacteria bacterium GR16-43]|nr:peptidase M20 [Betaproteobacteria bacterium GR16-43]